MNHIARSTLLIAVFFGIDKVLALVRQSLIGRQFGLSYEIDVFNAANNIPDLLSALISGGALGVALIPVLSEYLTSRGRPDTWRLFSQILNLAFLVTAVLSLVIALFAQPLVQYVTAPGFPAEQQALTVSLMRLDLFAILIFSISGLVMASLQANQHFLLPALAPGLYNIGQIFGLLVLTPRYGIRGMVYGVILGALLHLGIQIPGLLRFQFRWAPTINFSDPGVRQVLRLLIPRVATMFFLQIFFIARDNIASGLGEGAITALNYGWFIMQVPETLIGTAIAIAVLPTLAEQFARHDYENYTRTINQAIRTILALTLPAAALLAVALPPLVQRFFHLDDAGTDLVVWATRMYLLGLAGHALLEVAARSFYARQDARTPLYLAALNALVYIVLAVTFSRIWGAPGIALANTFAFTSEALLLLILLNRRQPGLLRVGSTFWRVLLVAVAGAALVWVIMRLPLPLGAMYVALGALGVGGLAVVPFLWPEVRMLLHIGDRPAVATD